MTARLRIAELVVSSETLDADALANRLGVAPESLDRDCWLVEARGSDRTDIGALVERVLDTAKPLWPNIKSLVEQSEGHCLLRIIAYIAPEDAVGAGFALEPFQLGMLAEVAAALDVDLYAG